MTALDARLRGHMPALDGVRGIAIAMVMWAHLWGCVYPTTAVERAIGAISKYGLLGVDLFFVLSGFLITGILVEAKGRARYFRTFYIRRALRIFPLYYGVLALLFWVAPLVAPLRGPNLAFLTSHQAWAWLYGINIYNSMHGELSFPYINHFWSLAVEEHFYFVWPLLVWMTPRQKLLPMSAAVVLASLGARVAGAFGGMTYTALYELTPFRMDQLAFGGMLAVAARQSLGIDGVARTMTRACGGAAAAVVALFALDPAIHHRGSEPNHHLRTAMWTVMFGGLIVAAVASPAASLLSRFLRSRAMIGLGKYSYGLYVFHHFFSFWAETHGVERSLAVHLHSHVAAGFTLIGLVSLASLAAARTSFRLYESRFLAMKRPWTARTGSLPTTTTESP